MLSAASLTLTLTGKRCCRFEEVVSETYFLLANAIIGVGARIYYSTIYSLKS